MWRFFNDPSKHKFDWEHGLHGVDRLVSHFQIWNWKIFHNLKNGPLFVDSQRTFIHIYIYLLITEERFRETAKTECFLWLSKRAIRLAIIVEIKTQNPLMQFKMYLFFLQSLHNFYNKMNNQKKINRRLRFANALYRDFVSKEEKSVVCAGLHKSSPQLSLQVATSYIIYCRFVIRSQATPLPYQPI